MERKYVDVVALKIIITVIIFVIDSCGGSKCLRPTLRHRLHWSKVCWPVEENSSETLFWKPNPLVWHTWINNWKTSRLVPVLRGSSPQQGDPLGIYPGGGLDPRIDPRFSIKTIRNFFIILKSYKTICFLVKIAECYTSMFTQ